ncbi:uncharacterized protein OCT59_016041 [Rhizophagus irregularis]|nr:hypothetical protein OCT59_016041 [Rhizophagus irregularis]
MRPGYMPSSRELLGGRLLNQEMARVNEKVKKIIEDSENLTLGESKIKLKVEKVSNMAQLHSFYISNAQQELNYAGKNLSEDAFNQIMQDYAKSLTLDSDMFEINDDNDDNDPFENLIPKEEEENNDQLNEDDSNLLVGNLIKLNNVNREDIELEEVDHGDLEFSVDDILANVNRLNNKI